jgi:hypothetical protein
LPAGARRRVALAPAPRPTPARVRLVVPRAVVIGEAATLEAKGVTGAGGWRFGDETSGAGLRPRHRFLRLGRHDLIFAAARDDGSVVAAKSHLFVRTRVQQGCGVVPDGSTSLLPGALSCLIACMLGARRNNRSWPPRSRRETMARRLWVAGWLMVVGAGCSATYIRNTTVEDSAPNRRVIAFCERYRHAMEGRNATELLSLASSRYYEDGGTPTAADDYDYAGLRQVLEERFRNVKQVRYDIEYRDISSDHGRIDVDFTYSASFQLQTPLGDRWYRKVEDNRLVLERVRSGDGFRILAGM